MPAPTHTNSAPEPSHSTVLARAPGPTSGGCRCRTRPRSGMPRQMSPIPVRGEVLRSRPLRECWVGVEPRGRSRRRSQRSDGGRRRCARHRRAGPWLASASPSGSARQPARSPGGSSPPVSVSAPMAAGDGECGDGGVAGGAAAAGAADAGQHGVDGVAAGADVEVVVAEHGAQRGLEVVVTVGRSSQHSWFGSVVPESASTARSASRAREAWLLTVPGAIPSAWAISRSERSS